MILLLRTLTEKSTIGFSKLKNYTVDQALSMKKHHYLIDMYYNLGNISFSDDVLLKLNIYPEDRIEKPGKNPELGIVVKKKYWDFVNKDKSLLQKFKEIAMRKKEKRLQSFGKQLRCVHSPARLQARNHGR